MKRKKVLLITPPYHSGVVESAGTWLNLGFVYLAGRLRSAGYEVEIYDAMSRFHGYDEISRRIDSERPDVVASTAITATVSDCIGICRIAKEIDASIVTALGNVHPTFMWKEILEDPGSKVDYIVRGEGEITFPELLDCHFLGGERAEVKGISFLSGGKAVATPAREFVPCLDSLPAAWDLVDWSIYSYRPKPGSVLAIVSSSRGCTQHCSFCSQQLFWERKWRPRSPESFVAELEMLHRDYGVTAAMIADETPTRDRERWTRILDLLSERSMDMELFMETRVRDIIRDRDILERYREAGIVHIYVGVESISPETLRTFAKEISVEESRLAIELINREDIISETSFVLGMPYETRESIDTTLELAKHYGPDMAFFLAIAPWPYADLYGELKQHIVSKDYRKYNLIEPVVRPLHMTTEELRSELDRATRLFYMDRFARLKTMSPFKREYMIAVMRLLMEHSYIASQMKAVQASMPEEMQRFLSQYAEHFSPIP